MSDYPMRKHTGGYVVLGNETVNDSRLSFKARGILAYLLGRPPGWKFAADRIARESPKEGREAVLSGLRELAEVGYYRWTRVQVANGQWVVITEVAEHPSLMPEPPTGLTACEREAGSVGPESANPAPAGPASAEPGPAEPSPKSVPEGVTTGSQNPPAPSEQAPPAPEPEPEPTPKRRGTRLPADWTPGFDEVTFATGLGFAPEEINLIGEVFRDHWVAQPGQRGVKVDWTATWRNWVRRDLERRKGKDRKVDNRHVDKQTDNAETAERRAAWGETT